jgi:hypothetical protein
MKRAKPAEGRPFLHVAEGRCDNALEGRNRRVSILVRQHVGPIHPFEELTVDLARAPRS